MLVMICFSWAESALNREGLLRKIEAELKSLAAESAGDGLDLRDHSVQIHQPSSHGFSSSEGQELLCQGSSLACRSHNSLQIISEDSFLLGLQKRQLGGDHDGLEYVVEVMGDSGADPPDSVEALGPLYLLLQVLPLRHIPNDDLHSNPILEREGSGGYLGREAFACLCNAVEFDENPVLGSVRDLAEA
jgi:hypothetical protein